MTCQKGHDGNKQLACSDLRSYVKGERLYWKQRCTTECNAGGKKKKREREREKEEENHTGKKRIDKPKN